MQTLIKSKLNLDKVGKKAWTTSTVLIPDDLLDYYRTRSEFFKKRRIYFRHLIHTYGRYLNHYGNFPYSKQWKKKYQEKRLGLVDCHFVPNPADWEELRNLSQAYGLSMCHLFVILIQLEKARWESAGCPSDFFEKPPKISRKKREKKQKNRHSALNKINKRNSIAFYPENAREILENLLNSNYKTILHRSIDFDELELLRIGWVRQ